MMMKTTNIKKIRRKEEIDSKKFRKRMFNDLSLGFEGMEDYMRMEMMVITLNN
jgi:hypothetical protein